MKKPFFIILLISYCCFYISCENSSTAVNQSLAKDKRSAVEETKKTQALILTQAFEFDPKDKNKVTGDYVAQTKITVPQNLMTQSKWIMFE
ncbi:MAG: hypothetical protein AAF985_20220, partial [Bacteroidota bacterium]